MAGWYRNGTWYGADSNFDQGNYGTRTIVFPQLMSRNYMSEQGLYSGDAYNFTIVGKYENKRLYCYAQYKSSASQNSSSEQFNYKNDVYVYMVVY